MKHENVHRVLRDKWGFTSFRSRQEEIIGSVLDGRDTMVVLPTGGGKSLCYQLPAVASDGMTLVISPLIALMKDQVEALERKQIAAAAVYSGMHFNKIDRILDNAVQGAYDILYLSPERLQQDMARLRIPRMPLEFIAVDEAHCISQWGHDFRPAYRRIAEIREDLPGIPFIALTASATPKVQRDIIEQLELEDPNVFIESVRREQLSYVALYQENKNRQLLHILRRVEGSALVYRRNRKDTKKISSFLSKNGLSSDYYHAGRSPEKRTEVQESWLKDNTRIVVCTNAFGMGIDKPDVRSVIHMDVPASPEEYYQEAGRAGRDGEMSYAVLMYNDADLNKQEQMLESLFPSMDEILKVYKALFNYYDLATGSGQWGTFPLDLNHFAKQYKLKTRTVLAVLNILEENEYLVLSDALFQTTSVRFTIEQEDLYDYQLKHPEMDPFIKALLRSYEGLFSGFTKVREESLAKQLKTSERKIEGALVRLSRDDLIDLQPRTDKPTITFLEERLPERNVRIDQKQFDRRKQVKWDQWESMKGYTRTERCRQLYLQEYFGEDDGTACGICDICRGSEDQKPSKEEVRKVQTIVDRYLKHDQPCSVERITRHFPVNKRKKILRALDQLQQNGYLRMTDDMTLLPISND